MTPWRLKSSNKHLYPRRLVDQLLIIAVFLSRVALTGPRVPVESLLPGVDSSVRPAQVAGS